MFTYSQALEVAINAVADNVEVVEKLTALKVQIEKRHTSTKPTKAQVENEAVKAEILDVLSGAESPLRVSDILKLMSKEYTSQKVSALLRQMVKAGTVVKSTEKKVSLFALA